MSTETKQYRSPTKKLLVFFRKSRDQWKAKCLAAKQRVKRLQTTVADLRASRQRWKDEARHLFAENALLREALAAEQKVAISHL